MSCTPADPTGVFGSTLYDEATRGEAPEAAANASLGCGVPTAVADLSDGEVVLDLGSGAGADVLISARRVAPSGRAGVAAGLRGDRRVRAHERRRRDDLVKLWMHLSEDEQLRRFRKREKDPLKAWKLTDEDWRNREKRGAYEQAVEDMLERTDHGQGPWTLVEGDNKKLARVKVIETVIAAMERGAP